MIFVLSYLSLAMSLQPSPDSEEWARCLVPHVLIMYLSHIFSLDLAPSPVSGHPSQPLAHTGLGTLTTLSNHRLYFVINGIAHGDFLLQFGSRYLTFGFPLLFEVQVIMNVMNSKISSAIFCESKLSFLWLNLDNSGKCPRLEVNLPILLDFVSHVVSWCWPECCPWPRPLLGSPPSIPSIKRHLTPLWPGLNEILMSLIWKVTPRICSLVSPVWTRWVTRGDQANSGLISVKECWFRQRLIRTQEPVIIFTFRIKILPRPDNQHCLAVSRPCLRIANCIVRKICNLGLNVGRWGHGWVFPPCVNVL